MGFLKNIAGTLIGGAIGNRSKGKGLMGAGIGYAATRLATRSVPGALMVGGGYLAKKLFDRHRAKKSGQAAPPAQAKTTDNLQPSQPVAPEVPPPGSPNH